MNYPPDNADITARIRLELEELARVERRELAIRLVALALDAITPAEWGPVLEEGIERAIGYR